MQGPFRTHYDNLMVSRTAPPEVIAAAYRVLSKRLHPDVNQGSEKAERIMRIVNGSYAVLADPVKRQAHDQWIRDREAEMSAAGEAESYAEQFDRPTTPTSSHIARFWGWYLVGGIVAFGIFADFGSSPAPSGLPAYDPSPAVEAMDTSAGAGPSANSYVRPTQAPNGAAWPSSAAYVGEYRLGRADGLSQLTIDNSSNSTDMFVKLVALDADKTSPIRHAYIPAMQSFTMNKIRAGRYDVRYMDLSDGSLSRSEEFELQEISEPNGVRYSVTTMTLYKIANGNMQTYSLDPSEF
jgi:curved DNA-binding protein CbpA